MGLRRKATFTEIFAGLVKRGFKEQSKEFSEVNKDRRTCAHPTDGMAERVEKALLLELPHGDPEETAENSSESTGSEKLTAEEAETLQANFACEHPTARPQDVKESGPGSVF